MSVENLEQVVQGLNEILATKYGYEDGSVQFEYQTNGWCSVIKFLGVVLYSSEDDYREWDEDKQDYSFTIEEDIKLKAHCIVRDLAELSFI